MSEQILIDANALIDWFRAYGHRDEEIPFESLVEYVRDVASTIDAVTAVRCGECKQWSNGFCFEWHEYENEPARTKVDDFCSYGERKDKEDKLI